VVADAQVVAVGTVPWVDRVMVGAMVSLIGSSVCGEVDGIVGSMVSQGSGG
jgi:hypothetical protein